LSSLLRSRRIRLPSILPRGFVPVRSRLREGFTQLPDDHNRGFSLDTLSSFCFPWVLGLVSAGTFCILRTWRMGCLWSLMDMLGPSCFQTILPAPFIFDTLSFFLLVLHGSWGIVSAVHLHLQDMAWCLWSFDRYASFIFYLVIPL
jgi:hypothetical protein